MGSRMLSVLAMLLCGSVLADEKPCAVMFTATWCGPCKTMHGVMNSRAVQRELARFDFDYVDIDSDFGKEAMRKYGVTAVPTLVRDGNKQLVGVQSEATVVKWLREAK